MLDRKKPRTRIATATRDEQPARSLVREHGPAKVRDVLWYILVFSWPVMRFVVPVVVFWKFLMMLLLWSIPGTHAGLTFLAYFASYTFLQWAGAYYRPQGMRK